MNTLHYRLRIRNAADDADDLVITSLPSGPNPYIAEEGIPSGDGQTLNPVTGEVVSGAMSVGVIDALTEVSGWTEVHVVDFGAYADTAALLADWEEVDPDGVGTWTLETPTELLDSVRVPQVSVSGAHLAGESTRIQQVFGGFTPGASVRARWSQYENRSSLNGPANQWNVLSDRHFLADDAGEVTLGLYYTMFSSITVSPTNTIQIDRLILEELVTGEDRIVTSKLADAQGRQQLLSRRAFLEETEDLGTSWDVIQPGYVTVCELTTANRYTITVGESRRVEASVRVFEVPEPGFDRVSCILGGPVIGDFGPIPDLGRPRFQVVDTGEAGIVVLQWTGGELYQPIGEATPGINASKESDNLGYFNALANQYLGEFDGGVGQPFPDLVVRLMDIETGPGVTSNPPTGANGFPALTADEADFTPVSSYSGGLSLPGSLAYDLIGETDRIRIRWPAGLTEPDDGDRCKLVIFPRTISERNPLHWRGHPVDLATGLMTLRGQPYDAASAAAVRAELGDSLLIELRITAGMSLKEALEQFVYGPFGVAPRMNDAGEIEFITTRHRPSDPPDTTITIGDLVSYDPTAWRIEESSAVNKVTFRTKAFTPIAGPPRTDGLNRDPNNPIDYIRATDVPVEATPDASDYEIYGDRSITYTLPGRLLNVERITYVAAVAAEIFEERGRGAMVSQLAVRRGGPDPRLGEETILDLPHLPTANPTQSPVSQRGSTPRIAVVVRRTPTPSGPLLTVVDRGIALQAGLVPEFTIAPSSGEPRKIATVVITNGAALEAEGVTVRIEWAVSGTTPTTGQLLRTLDPATDALTFDLPAVDAGARVWVRMRTEQVGTRPGTWSAFDDADLDDLDAPTSFAGTLAGGFIDLTWVLGANATDIPLEILLREDAVTDFDSVALLPIGSTQYRLALPTPGTDYVIGVRHREAAPFAGVSPTTTLSETSEPTTGLSAPIDPAVFADGAGTFGLEVTATVIPSGTEFWVATETAVGSGIPDTSAAVQIVPSVAGGRTRFTNPSIAANDGKRRFLKARHVVGEAVSEFCLELSVLPWTVTVPDPGEDPPPDDGDPGQDTGAPLTSHIYFHAAGPVFDEFVAESTLTEVEGNVRLIKDTTGYAEVRLVAQQHPDDASGPAGSYMVAECRPRGSTDVADFRSLGVLAGPSLAMDQTPGTALASDWVTLAPECIGDMEFRRLTVGGDDATPVAFKTLGLEFRRAGLPGEPETPDGEAPTGLLAWFLGDRGKVFSAGGSESAFFDFGAYADTAAMFAAGWTESDPHSFAVWTLVTPGVVLDSARVPQIFVNGFITDGWESSLSLPFGGFTPGATVRVRWSQYENAASGNGPANTWNATTRDLIADGSGNITVSFIWHETGTVFISNRTIKFDRLTFEEQGSGLIEWQDQSGNGNDATWVSGPKGTDGGDTVILTGAGTLDLPAGMLDGYPAVEIYAAVEAAADPGGTDKTIWTLGTDPSLYPDGSGVLQEGAGRAAAASAGNPSTTLAAMRLYHVRVTEAAVTVVLDEVVQATLPPGTLAWNSTLSIGGGVTFSELRIYGLLVPHTSAERDEIYLDMAVQTPTVPVDPPVIPPPDPGDPPTPITGAKSFYAAVQYENVADVPPVNGVYGTDLSAASAVADLAIIDGLGFRAIPYLVGNDGMLVGGVYQFAKWLASLNAYGGTAIADLIAGLASGMLPGIATIDEPYLARRYGGAIPWALVDEMSRRIKLKLGSGTRCYMRLDSVMQAEKSGFRFVYTDGVIAQYNGYKQGTIETWIAQNKASALRIGRRIMWAMNLTNGGAGESGKAGSQSGHYFLSAREARVQSTALATQVKNGTGDGLCLWLRDWPRVTDIDYLQRSDISAAFENAVTILAAS